MMRLHDADVQVIQEKKQVHIYKTVKFYNMKSNVDKARVKVGSVLLEFHLYLSNLCMRNRQWVGDFKLDHEMSH